MKRLTALLLALAMALTVFASCGKIDDTPSIEVQTTPVVTTEAEGTTESQVTTEVTTLPEETQGTTEATTTVPVTEAPATTTEASFNVTKIDPITKYATDDLNVRKGPDTTYEKLGKLTKGAEITVTGRVGTWYQIEFEGKVGYVSASYVADASAPEVDDEPIIDDDDIVIEDDDPVVDDDEPTVDNTSYDWVENNGWGSMINRFNDPKYVTVINQVMEGIKNLQTTILVEPVIGANEANDFVFNVLCMLPIEECYVKNITYSKYPNGMMKSAVVTYYVNSRSEADKMVNQLRSAANSVVGNLSSSMSDYQKIKYLHDWLVKKCTPDTENVGGPWADSAYGSIVDGRPICLGYAKGMFYLLSKAGIEATFATGVGDKAKHIWVKAKAGGNWYNIDIGWDDPGTPNKNDKNYIGYEYFMVTDSFMKQSHAEVHNMNDFFKDPSCTATSLDWYRVNGYYASPYSEAQNIIKQAIKDATKSGNSTAYAYIKLGSKNVYDQFKSYYSTGTLSSELLGGTGYTCSLRYFDSDTWCITYVLKK